MWLGVERRGRMVKKCGWGSKHVAGGWQMCIIEQINEKKCRKKKKTYLGPNQCQMRRLGPWVLKQVKTGSWEVGTHS
jgi:hypothetical protein